MKIGIQTWGSHGDVRPFIALAEGLQSAGHDVTLVITCVDSAAYSSVVSPSGVNIRVVASPVVQPEAAADMGWTVVHTRSPLKQLALILERCFAPAEDAMFAAAQELVAESELLIGHHFMHPLQIAAEQAGKPYVSVLLSHGAVPSAYSHPLDVPRIFNSLLWWVSRKLMNSILAPYANRLRGSLGMPPVKDVVDEIWLSSYLTLVAVSPRICERQPDWPAWIQVCGFLDMPNIQLEGKLTDEMASFLAAGDAPVYMTLGSWTPVDLPNLTDTLRIFTEAARQAGCRAIIQGAGWEQCGFQSDDRILYVSASPHHLIFSRCAMVVHHGGAGTTQAATLAGRPSVVVAHIGEQEHWARELRRLGITGKFTTRRSVTAKKLASLIRDLRANTLAIPKAEAIARAMADENGVKRAVQLIGGGDHA